MDNGQLTTDCSSFIIPTSDLIFMFQLTYGPYTHQPGECKIDITRSAGVSSQGTIATVLHTWNIAGRLQGDSVAAVNQLVAELQRGYATHGLDVALVGTNLGIKSADTLGGIRVVTPPYFPDGGNAEGSTFRSYQIVLEAEIPTGDPAAEVLEWQQSITFTGGGPRFVFLPNLNGLPTKQMVQQATTFRASQIGSAKGLSGYPVPPPPIWVYALHQDTCPVTVGAPTLYGTGSGRQLKDFVITWDYEYEDSAPLIGGLPTSRPAV